MKITHLNINIRRLRDNMAEELTDICNKVSDGVSSCPMNTFRNPEMGCPFEAYLDNEKFPCCSDVTKLMWLEVLSD